MARRRTELAPKPGARQSSDRCLEGQLSKLGPTSTTAPGFRR